MVFRFQTVPFQSVAEYMFACSKSLTGKNVPYDFGMNYNSSELLFEVVSKGLRDIGTLMFPYKTKSLIPFCKNQSQRSKNF